MARCPYLIPLIIGEFNYQISDSLYFVRGAMFIDDVKLEILVHDFVDGRIIFACAGRFVVGVRIVSALSEGFTVGEEMMSTLLGRFYEGEEIVSSLLGVFSAIEGLGTNPQFRLAQSPKQSGVAIWSTSSTGDRHTGFSRERALHSSNSPSPCFIHDKSENPRCSLLTYRNWGYLGWGFASSSTSLVGYGLGLLIFFPNDVSLLVATFLWVVNRHVLWVKEVLLWVCEDDELSLSIQRFFPPGGDFLEKMVTGLPENGCLGMVMTKAVLKSQETTVRGDARRGTERYSDGQANRGLEESPPTALGQRQAANGGRRRSHSLTRISMDDLPRVSMPDLLQVPPICCYASVGLLLQVPRPPIYCKCRGSAARCFCCSKPSTRASHL
ncbi:hypothetical protein WN943_025481 [Citrus x changshan-huyou]